MTLEKNRPDDQALAQGTGRRTEQASQSMPGLEPLVRSPRTVVSAAVAKRLFRAAVGRLAVTVVEEPTGRRLGQGGPIMRLHRPDEFYARLGRDGLIGFGESYLTGAWDTDDLAGFLTVPAARIATLIPDSLQRMRAFVTPRLPHHQRSTEANSQANISHHYDLSNELFALFLDETLSYSSALFDTSSTSAPKGPGSVGDHLVSTPPEPTDHPDALLHDEDFAEAQGRKIERLLDEAGVTAGSRVLEIGTGWGELAIRAARRGATVHSITLSVEQLELAEDRIAAAGFADRVEVELMDYRALGATGRTYDAVVSVEMIEAVGHEFWGTYFQTIDQVLAHGGKVAIQAITMPHDRMLATRGGHTWINKWIFPGGFLPSVEVIDEVTRGETDLRLVGQLEMGSHYAETLRRWDRRFLAQRDAVLALGFDDMFMRVWHFYLAYSQAGFASGYINVSQLTFTRETP
ncbi:cyclopropane-fatty-acyl-phospholipid synthase [Nocardioides alpinus]|uniref:Class I SAM-dependent methyltransferase n=1 Tax=Nocardioides alpinus TaxID=748909 RepID=A0A1I0WIN8_9ACTN|nr:cyclopropane-fatty-acyl-phospholipid synthase family protein [Nocardioides alpinus]PKH37953.1 class I SAM-dependent methyltransferase [Nocardioides alpinus]SFA88424.1 cyclopropane-fatty-acyl-phospholipid synthase [Nocardioides alpinus]